MYNTQQSPLLRDGRAGKRHQLACCAGRAPFGLGGVSLPLRWRAAAAAAAAMDASNLVSSVRGSNGESSDRGRRGSLNALAGRPGPHLCCSVRFAIMMTICVGVAAQTALRSVPNLVFNGEDGMAAELSYSNTQRGAILASFGWAYTAMQIPGGVLSQLIGPKRTIFYFVLFGSVAGSPQPRALVATSPHRRMPAFARSWLAH